MFRSWQDLQDMITKNTANPPARHPGKSGAKGGNQTGRGASQNAQVSSNSKLPFADAWKAHCSVNQRLRDPKALPVLLRQGVPEALRPDVWSHCLGLEVDLQLEASLTPTGDYESDISTDVGSPTDRDETIDAALVVVEQETEDGSEPSQRKTKSSPQAQVLEPVLDHQLPSGISELIDADVARTLPSHKEFRRRGGPARLRGVLRSLASTDAELGYCQSLNFLAAIFILVFMDDRVVLSAVGKTLMKLGIRRWYTDGMQQLRADTLVLEELIRERLPNIHEALSFHKFDLLFVSSKWFLCLFTTVLDGEAIKRVWDVMLCDGIEAVFRVALTLLARKEPLILSAKSCDDLIFMFQEGQTDACPDTIVRAAYDPDFVGALSRADLSKRRQQAASQISKDDTRSEMRQQHLLRGGVRPASILAR